jgi:hypothetical protein
VTKMSPDHVLVRKRDLVELYDAALELREATDRASRVRIDAAAACDRLEVVIRRIAPGILLAKTASNEVTPVAVPKPSKRR